MKSMTFDSLGRPVEMLLVEDNYGDALLMREACSTIKTPIQVSVAEDGEEAMSILRREGPHTDRLRPDLVVLDVNLPGISGHEVLKAIKFDPVLQHIPIFMMSSSSADHDIRKSRELGAALYFVKPSSLHQLIEVVTSIESFWSTVITPSRSTGSGPPHVS